MLWIPAASILLRGFGGLPETSNLHLHLYLHLPEPPFDFRQVFGLLLIICCPVSFLLKSKPITALGLYLPLHSAIKLCLLYVDRVSSMFMNKAVYS